jgi:hypothetical protein
VNEIWLQKEARERGDVNTGIVTLAPPRFAAGEREHSPCFLFKVNKVKARKIYFILYKG